MKEDPVAGVRFEREGRQFIIHTDGPICTTVRELLQSHVFERVVQAFCDHLHQRNSPLLEAFLPAWKQDPEWTGVINLLRILAENPWRQVASILPNMNSLAETDTRSALHRFVERLYDYWRSLDRFMVLHSEPGPSSFDRRPYRSFNATIETLTHQVRAAYRDVCENITGDHPRVYRQVSAGVDVGLIAVPKSSRLPAKYHAVLGDVPFIRHVWMTPPMIIDPPMNKRSGEFQKVDANPLGGLSLEPGKWLCYPAQVGPTVVFVYIHRRFIGLGCSLANLFELATDEQIANGPDAVYCFGVPAESPARFGEWPTVFHEDAEDQLLVAAVPGEDRFGYFGYLKKMVLTLHNAAMIKRGRMPFHGAMVSILLKSGATANVLIIGDTATGKSESLEAFRVAGVQHIRDMRIIADDMGSLEIAGDGRLRGYGTEIGAFIRLDDLQQGYAFEQLDRAVIMSPQKINARVVVPVTMMEDVLFGCPVDFLLYANNYEQVDDDHPVIEPFDSPERALAVFREGAAMAKGTTTSTGLVHSYFANIFGPPQYRERHEALARATFHAAFDSGVFVGQLRTRLGIPGFETKGPEAAAESLLELIAQRQSGTMSSENVK